MGIYPQPNRWECGPYALKHALLMLGIRADAEEIARVAGTDESGTDEAELARAARRYGCELVVRRHYEPDAAQRDLDEYLNRGIPVLLCIYGWDHWVAAVGGEEGRYVVMDSRDPAVITIVTWEQLERALVYRERRGRGVTRTLYDLHPIVPESSGWIRARFTPARARRIRDAPDRSVARGWDRYLGDLIEIAGSPGPQRAFTVPLAPLLRARGQEILERADGRIASIEPAARRRILDNLCFVAETYHLEAVVGDEDAVVERTSAVIGRRARAALV